MIRKNSPKPVRFCLGPLTYIRLAKSLPKLHFQHVWQEVVKGGGQAEGREFIIENAYHAKSGGLAYNCVYDVQGEHKVFPLLLPLQENYVEYIFSSKCNNSRNFYSTQQYTSTCAPFVTRRTSNR